MFRTFHKTTWMLIAGLAMIPASATDITGDTVPTGTDLTVEDNAVFGTGGDVKTPERPVHAYTNISGSVGINIENSATEADLRVSPGKFVIGLGTPVPSGFTPGLFTLTSDGDLAIGAPAANATLYIKKAGDTSVDMRLQSSEGFFDWVLDNGQVKLKTRKFADGGSRGIIDQIVVDHDTDKVTFAGEASATVMEIRGGSDLSERFDVATDNAQPGMVVSIDPENPGALRLSTSAHDRTVAGIISGAGGVQTGMLMGQAGTIAYGDHPVALSGRVYCLVDATEHAVVPGDLLTTSSTAGHAMAVVDHAKAQGAIIGKAMTPLAQGEKGLVLVLVSLQ